MFIGIKYAPEIDYLMYKSAKSIEEIKTSFEHPKDKLMNLSMACIYDFQNNSFIEFDERYRRYAGRFLDVIKEFKDSPQSDGDKKLNN